MRKTIGILTLAILVSAQPIQTRYPRLQPIMWDFERHVLSWSVVEKQGAPTREFEIHVNTAEMYLLGKTDEGVSIPVKVRSFSLEEARGLDQLLHVLAKYASESTVWWDQENVKGVLDAQGAGQ
jgi:hypothetical protein